MLALLNESIRLSTVKTVERRMDSISDISENILQQAKLFQMILAGLINIIQSS